MVQCALALYKPLAEHDYWVHFFEGMTIEGAFLTSRSEVRSRADFLEPLYVTYCFTLATNVWSTVVIGHKAWFVCPEVSFS